MEYVNVQGIKIPALGFGTWQLTGQKCVKSVKSALKMGYRNIDTAQIYGNEAEIGSVILESGIKREDIFLTTKIWSSNLRYGNVISSVEESLEKLKTDYVDLLLIHWPNPSIPLEGTLKAMCELKEVGKVKNIRVSNFGTDLIKKAQKMSEAPIICDQVEYHPFLYVNDLLNYCQKENIMLTAYSPLARGRIIGNSVLKETGEKYGKSVSQVTLRWLIQQKNVSAIPKASSREHQEENFNIFDFKLTKEDMKRISDLSRDD